MDHSISSNHSYPIDECFQNEDENASKEIDDEGKRHSKMNFNSPDSSPRFTSSKGSFRRGSGTIFADHDLTDINKVDSPVVRNNQINNDNDDYSQIQKTVPVTTSAVLSSSSTSKRLSARGRREWLEDLSSTATTTTAARNRYRTTSASSSGSSASPATGNMTTITPIIQEQLKEPPSSPSDREVHEMENVLTNWYAGNTSNSSLGCDPTISATVNRSNLNTDNIVTRNDDVNDDEHILHPKIITYEDEKRSNSHDNDDPNHNNSVVSENNNNNVSTYYSFVSTTQTKQQHFDDVADRFNDIDDEDNDIDEKKEHVPSTAATSTTTMSSIGTSIMVPPTKFTIPISPFQNDDYDDDDKDEYADENEDEDSNDNKDDHIADVATSECDETLMIVEDHQTASTGGRPHSVIVGEKLPKSSTEMVGMDSTDVIHSLLSALSDIKQQGNSTAKSSTSDRPKNIVSAPLLEEQDDNNDDDDDYDKDLRLSQKAGHYVKSIVKNVEVHGSPKPSTKKNRNESRSSIDIGIVQEGIVRIIKEDVETNWSTRVPQHLDEFKVDVSIIENENSGLVKAVVGDVEKKRNSSPPETSRQPASVRQVQQVPESFTTCVEPSATVMNNNSHSMLLGTFEPLNDSSTTTNNNRLYETIVRNNTDNDEEIVDEEVLKQFPVIEAKTAVSNRINKLETLPTPGNMHRRVVKHPPASVASERSNTSTQTQQRSTIGPIPFGSNIGVVQETSIIKDVSFNVTNNNEDAGSVRSFSGMSMISNLSNPTTVNNCSHNNITNMTVSSTSPRMSFMTSTSSRGDNARKRISEVIRRELWSKEEHVVEDAIQELATCAGGTTSERNTIARSGGILAIVRAMEQHDTNPGIQIAGCHALEKLALETENELAIGEVGGVDAVLAAMMQHVTNESVQEAAWSALWNLTCGNATDEMTTDTEGGMNAIVACMKQHIHHGNIQRNACGALTNLCLQNPVRLRALAEADGFVAIASALQTHWDNDPVRTEAVHALMTLLEDKPLATAATGSSSPTAANNNKNDYHHLHIPSYHHLHRKHNLSQEEEEEVVEEEIVVEDDDVTYESR